MDYAALARCLGSDQPVYGIAPLAMTGTQGEPWRLEELAALHVDELLAFRPAGPFWIGGYSYGGLLAFEIARQLQERGRPVPVLALIDCAAPASGYRRWRWSVESLSGFVTNLPRWTKEFVSLDSEARRAPVLRKVGRRLRLSVRFGRIDSTDSLDLRHCCDVVPLSDEHRALMTRQVSAMRAYVPGRYPGRIMLFRARVQSLICSFDPEMGWGPIAAGGVVIREADGSHHSVLNEPRAGGIARHLKEALDGWPDACP